MTAPTGSGYPRHAKNQPDDIGIRRKPAEAKPRHRADDTHATREAELDARDEAMADDAQQYLVPAPRSARSHVNADRA